MQILPVYSRMGPKVKPSQFGATAKGPNGEKVWEYDGRKVTGKGIYVCATARAGTMYMSKVLNKLGYNIGHEMVEEDGCVGYPLVVIKPDNCFHQVRHPLKQIASMMAHKSWGFMEDIIDIPGRGLFGCMTYWLEWNKLCEEFCVWRYRLEDLPSVWSEFLDRIGHEPCEIPDVSTTENSSKKSHYYEKFRYEEVSWADLFKCHKQLAQEILDKANEYGYDTPEMDKVECQNLGELETAQVASV
jgi:hypothetical protein